MRLIRTGSPYGDCCSRYDVTFNKPTTVREFIDEVLNNNAFTVRGYFYVGFYDKKGNLMYSQLMSLPSVASGEKVICSTLIPTDDYPTGYSYVRYTPASLIKD